MDITADNPSLPAQLSPFELPYRQAKKPGSTNPKTTKPSDFDLGSILVEHARHGQLPPRPNIFRLLDLPYELRMLIYGHFDLDVYMQPTLITSYGRSYKVRTKLFFTKTVIRKRIDQYVIEYNIPPIMKVCRQIRTEVLQIPGRRTVLMLPDSQTEVMAFTPKSVPTVNYDKVTDIQIRENQLAYHHLPELEQYCPSLKTVVIVLSVKNYAGCVEQGFLNRLSMLRAHWTTHDSDLLESLSNWNTVQDSKALDLLVGHIMSGHGVDYSARSQNLGGYVVYIAMNRKRNFKLELQYMSIYMGSERAWGEQMISFDWDTGDLRKIGQYVEYARPGRAEG